MANAAEKSEQGGVQSVARIFGIIEVLAAHPAGVGLQKLAAEAGLAKSTTHRLLASLLQLGYARQDSVTGKYRLTLKMFELSSGIVNSMDIMGVAKLHLERLAQRTGEAVHLVIRDARDIVYIYKTESGPMRMSSRVGLRSPLYCTGVGKAILATLPTAEVEEIWKQSHPRKLTGNTITELPALLASFSLGPVYGVMVCLVKNLIHLTITSTGGAGELCNFLLGACFVFPAGLIYRLHKSRKTAILGALIGAVIMALLSIPLNYYVTYPIYANFMPIDTIISMYQAIRPSVNGLLECLIVFNAPFTLLKGLLVAAICFLVYKPLSPLIHGKR